MKFEILEILYENSAKGLLRHAENLRHAIGDILMYYKNNNVEKPHIGEFRLGEIAKIIDEIIIDQKNKKIQQDASSLREY